MFLAVFWQILGAKLMLCCCVFFICWCLNWRTQLCGVGVFRNFDVIINAFLSTLHLYFSLADVLVFCYSLRCIRIIELVVFIYSKCLVISNVLYELFVNAVFVDFIVVLSLFWWFFILCWKTCYKIPQVVITRNMYLQLRK